MKFTEYLGTYGNTEQCIIRVIPRVKVHGTTMGKKPQRGVINGWIVYLCTYTTTYAWEHHKYSILVHWCSCLLNKNHDWKLILAVLEDKKDYIEIGIDRFKTLLDLFGNPSRL